MLKKDVIQWQNLFLMEGKFLYLVYCCVLFCSSLEGRSINDEEINRQLKLLNKLPIKTITTQYGDIFDCVEIHKQPAFDDPLLKNHKWKITQSLYHPKESIDKNKDSNASPVKIGVNGTGCPFGTVPIRRTRKEQLLYYQEHRKYNQAALNQSKFTQTGYDYYRMFLLKDNDNLYGTSARLNIWSLNVTNGYASSIGAYVLNDQESLEAGWMVNPHLFGDQQSRLYVAWSRGLDTGCENILCSGFVQVHSSIPLGINFDRMSVQDGPQYEIRIEIKKDVRATVNGGWMLLVSNELIGYWPQELFTNLGISATSIAWGGTARTPAGSKLTPPMGSGVPADNNFRESCYIRRILLMNREAQYYDAPGDLSHIKERPYRYCWTIKDLGFNKNDDWRRNLYVGGPGCIED